MQSKAVGDILKKKKNLKRFRSRSLLSAGFVVEDINHPSKDFTRLKGQISTSISPEVHAQTDLRLAVLWA